MKIDILAFGPHPDDVELLCGGTVAKLVKQGYKVGLVDMTRGELGTRGSAEERDMEAAEAARILGVTFRENIGLPDGGLNSRDYDQRHKVVEVIRKHAPKLVICPGAKDRHPDHKQGMELVEEAVFMANVGKYPSEFPRHKVDAVMKYPMWWDAQPDFVVDISDVWDTRMEAVRAYKTQFYTPGVTGPETFLAAPQFVEWMKGRYSHFGALIAVPYAEPWLIRTPVPVHDPFDVLVNGPGTANP